MAESSSLQVKAEQLSEAIRYVTDMSIKLFRDPDLEKLILTPANLQVGTPVYVQLSVDKQKLHADGPAKLIVEECYGSASDVNDKFTVIQNQIAIDDGTDILRSPLLHEVRFRMELFRLSPNSKELYLTCSTYVCPSSDDSNRCSNRAAQAQHTQNAGRVAASDAEELIAQPIIGSHGVIPHNEILQPKLKRQPDYFPDELLGAGIFAQEEVGEGHSINNRKEFNSLYLFLLARLRLLQLIDCKNSKNKPFTEGTHKPRSR